MDAVRRSQRPTNPERTSTEGSNIRYPRLCEISWKEEMAHRPWRGIRG